MDPLSSSQSPLSDSIQSNNSKVSPNATRVSARQAAKNKEVIQKTKEVVLKEPISANKLFSPSLTHNVSTSSVRRLPILDPDRLNLVNIRDKKIENCVKNIIDHNPIDRKALQEEKLNQHTALVNKVQKGVATPKEMQVLAQVTTDLENLDDPHINLDILERYNQPELQTRFSKDRQSVLRVMNAYVAKTFFIDTEAHRMINSKGSLNSSEISTVDRRKMKSLFGGPHSDQALPVTYHLRTYREKLLKFAAILGSNQLSEKISSYDKSEEAHFKRLAQWIQKNLAGSEYIQKTSEKGIFNEKMQELLIQMQATIEEFVKTELNPHIEETFQNYLGSNNYYYEGIKRQVFMKSLTNDTTIQNSNEFIRPIKGSYLQMTKTTPNPSHLKTSFAKQPHTSSRILQLTTKESMEKLENLDIFGKPDSSRSSDSFTLSSRFRDEKSEQTILEPFSKSIHDEKNETKEVQQYLSKLLMLLCQELAIGESDRRFILDRINLTGRDVTAEKVSEALFELYEDIAHDFDRDLKPKFHPSEKKTSKRNLKSQREESQRLLNKDSDSESLIAISPSQDLKKLLPFLSLFNQDFLKGVFQAITFATIEQFNRPITVKNKYEWEDSQDKHLEIQFDGNEVRMIVEKIGYLNQFEDLVVSQVVEMSSSKADLKNWKTDVLLTLRRPKQLEGEKLDAFNGYENTLKQMKVPYQVVIEGGH